MFPALRRLLRRGLVDPAQLLLPLWVRRRATADPSTPVAPPQQLSRRRRPPRDEDAMAVEKLLARHAEFNATRFGGALGPIRIEVSRRLRSRLGYYRLAARDRPAVIVISRRHLRRHGWREVDQTLLHEMVHQWQEERGAPVDHGAIFRAKAQDVGAVPRARRAVGGDRRVARSMEIANR